MKKYAALQRISLDNLYNTFLGLTPRQQLWTLAGAIGAVAGLIVLPVSLASGKLGGLEERIADTRAKLGEIARRVDQFNRVRARQAALEGAIKSGFDSAIASTLEGIESELDIKGNVESQKEKPVAPSNIYDEVSVEVKVGRMSLQQLVTFLHRIENAPNKVLRIKGIDIRQRFDNKHLVDAKFDVCSYKLTQEAEI